MPDHEDATCRARSRADGCDAVDRPRRCDRVLGRNSAGDDRSVTRGFAAGVSLLVVGFEFEYANSREDLTDATPSLRTTSGNVFVQTFGLPGFQLYATTGAGIYRERLGNDQETALLLNNGGGVKINARRSPPGAHRLSRVHPERQSAAHQRAADLRGTESGILKEQRAESRGHSVSALCPLPSYLCPVSVDFYFE